MLLFHRIRRSRFLPLAFVGVLAVFSVRWLFLPGFLPTHDGEYHLIRFYEFSKMLAAGYLFPRWAPGLNSGYGVPLFIFFYPLPNYIGSLFHFAGWSLADSFRLTMAVGYVTGVVASYFWIKRLYGIAPAVAGSIIGAFTPYWFVDIFVRGSVGEVLALSFIFAALACIGHEKRTLLSFTIAGIILSHNIMAMIFLPILFLYAWMTDRSMLRWMIVGIILTVYFWVPALVERGYVVGLNTVNYRDHFPLLAQLLIPSWGTGFSGPGYALDEMSYQIGIIPLMFFLSAVVFFITRLSFPRKRESIFMLFTVAMGIALFLMLEVSAPVWEGMLFLTTLQYPWRLLSVVVISTPFFAASFVSRIRIRFIAAGMAMLAIAFSYFYTKPVLYASRSDEYYLSRREFTDGTSSLGNGFSTAWMGWQPERPPQRMEIVSGEGSVTMKEEGLTTFITAITVARDAVIRTNIAYYPGWRVVVDGKSVPVSPDDQGTISISVPQGKHTVKVYFSETPLRRVADLVSFACLFWLLYSSILRKSYARSNRHNPASNRS